MATATQTHSTQCTQPSDNEVRFTRVVDAPRKRVWEAWTNPEHVPRWLLGPGGWSMALCEMDLRADGPWRYVWKKEDGSQMEMKGAYQEVKSPSVLVSTESWGGDWPQTLNTLVLSEENGATTMKLTMLYPSKKARDAAMETGMKDGLAQSFDRLEKYLKEEL